MPYIGEGSVNLTVGGELNKVAANISLGRNFAGVHWRSDYTESVILGEEVAVKLMAEQAGNYNEDFSLSFTSFKRDQNGKPHIVTISKAGAKLAGGSGYPYQ